MITKKRSHLFLRLCSCGKPRQSQIQPCHFTYLRSRVGIASSSFPGGFDLSAILIFPEGVDADAAGNVYILNSAAVGVGNQLSKFDPAGTFVEMIAIPDVNNPTDMAIDILKMQGDNHCPLTGQKISGRNVIQVIDKDHHTFQYFTTFPGASEVTSMEITYTRMTSL